MERFLSLDCTSGDNFSLRIDVKIVFFFFKVKIVKTRLSWKILQFECVRLCNSVYAIIISAIYINAIYINVPPCLDNTDGGRVTVEVIGVGSISNSIWGNGGSSIARKLSWVSTAQRNGGSLIVLVTICHQLGENTTDGDGGSD